VDFNYEELKALDARLDDLEFQHHIEYFDGGHQWPPDRVFERALEWFELQAIRAGYRKPDADWASGLAARRLAEAESLESKGELRAALRVYRTVATDFAELPPAQEARQKVGELEASKDVQSALALEDRLSREDEAYRAAFWEFLDAAREGQDVDAEPVLRRLEVESLRERAEGQGEPARAAQRILEYLFVVTAFYEPPRYLDEGDPARAQVMLEVAAAIKPGHPLVCFGMARAHARQGQIAEGLEALACAVDAGSASVATLEEHADFEALRGHPAFAELVERAGRGAGGGSL